MIYELQALSRQKRKVVEDGFTWFCVTASDLRFLFPFWTKTQAELVLQRLMDERVIRSKPGEKSQQRLFAFVTNKFLE